MTDKEIVLELTKAIIEKQLSVQGVVSRNLDAPTLGENIGALFNAIAKKIAPTLIDLDKNQDRNKQ
ncbi:MAG: hypothetical protein KH703_00480 [Campylobacter gracilis]|jgi:hypothetical protein|uniref:hypothetical protein n=1 Tax=Campylobacter gracilis TaxID=824 RepID=UPI0026EFBCB6|nr:hypothetical protein [Campylobacter gracilis]MBS6151890.1 hypothetical protein [Campylobacter gracilis]